MDTANENNVPAMMQLQEHCILIMANVKTYFKVDNWISE